MKQTAVDFIIEKLAENGVLHSADIWMAKSIEKVQIIDAYCEGNNVGLLHNIPMYANDYYNEIFNKKV